jgi:DNA helicase II / ATP-dependent DNA helicase PcrA
VAPPLLIIAGAGSGKTNTLAHRVAHLVVSGADPRRIMLLTFSRRAAIEMQRRVERIMTKALGSNAGAMADALAWSGTFHAMGARLLREYASDIGLDAAFNSWRSPESRISSRISSGTVGRPLRGRDFQR